MLKVCKGCFEEKGMSEYYRDSRTKEGVRSRCKICTNLSNSDNESKYTETRKKYRDSHKVPRMHAAQIRYDANKKDILAKNKLWRESVTGRFNSYKRGAKTRGIIFALSREEFENFYHLVCDYCGDTVDGVGIDRVDNHIGYQLDNCVPCCTTCNRMKMTLGVGEFISHITKIYGRFYDNNSGD